MNLDLVFSIVVIGTGTFLIVYAVAKFDAARDRRADAWRRNHAHKRRWYE